MTVENVRILFPVMEEKDASLTFSDETFVVDRVAVFPTRVENVIFDALMEESVPTLATCKYVVLVVLPVRLEKVVLMVEMLIPFRVE